MFPFRFRKRQSSPGERSLGHFIRWVFHGKVSSRFFRTVRKYYPPDFDPSKIPKLKLPKDRQYVVRLMAPFNMRCKTCGEYIYKGKKFNARKETVQNEAYLGLPIFRFYIKCTRCLAEITFKTDPENTDYTMEHGATRNFQAEKLLEEEEKRVQKEREDEELNNPMKVLENRTKDSKLEMEVLENLQELKDLNQRQAHVDFEAMLLQHRLSQEQWRQQQEEEDERETAALLEEARHRRLLEDSDSEDEALPSRPRAAAKPNPTAILDETCSGSVLFFFEAGSHSTAHPDLKSTVFLLQPPWACLHVVPHVLTPPEPWSSGTHHVMAAHGEAKASLDCRLSTYYVPGVIGGTRG
ncbi:splicing factor YJU2 isoform X1 [Alexandromys fortis]|uniref:splicing factor YJU2 isoform X1 n=1 Tax=Alexandromys fortis TaxID=100897 RepID=UPI002153831A|nr:splicing factor YJU2 isoform X1 [Microtus fortis]